MKKLTIILTVGLVILMAACGGNKKQVKDFAEKFAGFVNANQADSLKAMYPSATFNFVTSLPSDSISIAENGENDYKINFGTGRWLEVQVNENGNVVAVNSKGIALFPQEKYEIAEKTGMINDTVPDLQAQELLNDSTYFEWLKRNIKQPVGLIKGKIRSKGGVDLYGRPCEGAVERMTCTVTNNTSAPISGKDYAITYAYSYWTCSDGSSPDGHTTGKKEGVNLAPGQSADIEIAIMDYGLKNVNVKYNVPEEELYKNMNPYSGNEYQEYLKEVAESANTNYDWLSTREVTAKDLENKTPEQLKIMRNWIYARHGYIFKTPELSDYFSQFPWYKPTSTVAPNLTKLEQANVAMIKSYE